MTNRLDRELRHVLRRVPTLSDSEMRLLVFIASYAHGCKLKQNEICMLTGWSESKLRRNIRSLKSKGLIEVKYRAYKHTSITIVCAEEQKAYADRSPVTDESPVTHDTLTGHQWNPDRSPVTGPILERDLERNLESVLKNQGKKEYDPRAHLKLVLAALAKNKSL